MSSEVIEQNIIGENEIEILNDLSGFLSFQKNFILEALLECDNKIIFVETGNQAGKTASIVLYYIMRMWGLCPVEKKNLRPDDPIRIIRFGSQTLPMESDENGEIRNTVYPQFKKFFPESLITREITVRKPMLMVKDIKEGKGITIEFVSYGQQVQSQAGVQRFSIYLDEEPSKSFYEEQLPRLLAADGDVIMGLTPVEEMSWTYDDIYQKAKVIYNSPAIIEYYQKKYGTKLERKQITDSKYDIAVIRAATDDNPTLSKEAINNMMMNYDDEGTFETRRYGVYHQVAGVIYKSFDENIHKISKDKYFPDGVPYQWRHARGIDYHQHTNWACGWIALSPQNEAFIYEEHNPSPDRTVTMEMAKEVAYKSKDYKFDLNLIDPLAEVKQSNTGLSPLDDLNRVFHEFKREGIGTGGYWMTWDTKSLRGRDIIKERLANSRLCGKPFNNRVTKNGTEAYLPTLWILDNCYQTVYMFKNWKWDVWARKEALVTKEEKNKEQDKYSHFPKMVECIFKSSGFTVSRYKDHVINQRENPYSGYLRARP